MVPLLCSFSIILNIHDIETSALVILPKMAFHFLLLSRLFLYFVFSFYILSTTTTVLSLDINKQFPLLCSSFPLAILSTCAPLQCFFVMAAALLPERCTWKHATTKFAETTWLQFVQQFYGRLAYVELPWWSLMAGKEKQVSCCWETFHFCVGWLMHKRKENA